MLIIISLSSPTMKHYSCTPELRSPKRTLNYMLMHFQTKKAPKAASQLLKHFPAAQVCVQLLIIQLVF